MLRRNIVALIDLLAVVNGFKWLFDGKRLPTLDLGEREEQVVCHASALALVMTDKARREAEM